MVTLVGMQDDFGGALKDLVDLEYDTVETYEAAINRLESPKYREKFTSFKEDHQRHIKEVSSLLKAHNIDPPTSASIGK